MTAHEGADRHRGGQPRSPTGTKLARIPDSIELRGHPAAFLARLRASAIAPGKEESPRHGRASRCQGTVHTRCGSSSRLATRVGQGDSGSFFVEVGDEFPLARIHGQLVRLNPLTSDEPAPSCPSQPCHHQALQLHQAHDELMRVEWRVDYSLRLPICSHPTFFARSGFYIAVSACCLVAAPWHNLPATAFFLAIGLVAAAERLLKSRRRRRLDALARGMRVLFEAIEAHDRPAALAHPFR